MQNQLKSEGPSIAVVADETERGRLAEAERRQRVLSDVSRVLLDYAGPDEIDG